MSHDFKCLNWKKEQLVELEGSAKAVHVSGCGTPGIWINTPSLSLIPADEFCDIIRYFMTNYDLSDDDPRLKLIEDLKKAKVIDGWEEGRQRLSLGGP